jgi:hypothetical protein
MRAWSSGLVRGLAGCLTVAILVLTEAVPALGATASPAGGPAFAGRSVRRRWRPAKPVPVEGKRSTSSSSSR